MTRSSVSFLSEGIKIAAHLNVPDTYKSGDKLPAIVAIHPFGGVKEQTAGTYASELSKQGFVTLAFDRRYQGESEGTPRQMEDPYAAGEDVKSAVTFLSLHEQVDPSRIGILGICAGGGYAVYAGSTDRRIKAVATISGVDFGGYFRALPKKDSDDILDASGPARIEFAKSGQIKYLPIVPELKDVTDDTTPLLREGADYYLTSRGGHPNSFNRTVIWSYEKIITYDSFARVDQISPRPLLLIAGSKADTLPHSEKAYKLAAEPKELHIIDGSTHIELYDRDVPKVLPKLAEFFKQKL
ncbi:hypothetical protein EDD11_007644 [Mortierella claussenii]|nr:hypothetical protein EDD11_007644 [Mortierella claussenii]